MTYFDPKRRNILVAAAGYSLISPVTAWSQDAWPTRPIRIIVGNSAGGTQDLMARILASEMGKDLGQPVVIENRAGANTNIGALLTVRAPADGYTLFVYSTSTAINASLYPALNYDPIKDFAFIGLFGKSPNILVVNAASPIHTLSDYIKACKDSPKGITFASTGTGSSTHLSGEMLKAHMQLNMIHVPYKGAAPALTDLLSGQVDSLFNAPTSMMPFLKSGRLRALAVTSSKRLEQLPDVPTMAESGILNFDVTAWNALAAPAETPKNIIKRLNTALNKALAMEATRKKFAELATVPSPGTEEDLRKLAVAEISRWRPIIASSGAKPE